MMPMGDVHRSDGTDVRARTAQEPPQRPTTEEVVPRYHGEALRVGA